MQVRMLARVENPSAVYEQGREYDLPRQKALRYVRAGVAELLDLREPIEAYPPVMRIDGIDETRAAKLEALGIETLEDLAGANGDIISETVDGVETNVANGWIEDAKELIG